MSGGCGEVASDKRRQFFLCPECLLIFVPERCHLTTAQERERYALHDNTVANAGYVRYLGEVAKVLDEHACYGASVLDYGCGEHAVLASILASKGYHCTPYDPLYVFPERLNRTTGRYSAIILCEVIEHCRDVRKTIADVRDRVEENGTVLIRTQCYPEPPESLPRWWYAQDPTHIAFFSTAALACVARLLNKKFRRTSVDDIYLFT